MKAYYLTEVKKPSNKAIEDMNVAELRAALQNLTAKKKETTKQMYLFNVCFVTAIVAVTYILMLLSAYVEHIDLSPTSVIVPAAFGELAIHTGFVVWKAKCENIHKYPDVYKKQEEEL